MATDCSTSDYVETTKSSIIIIKSKTNESLPVVLKQDIQIEENIKT
jgi:hypothetical protein